jgi:hypothetical protein
MELNMRVLKAVLSQVDKFQQIVVPMDAKILTADAQHGLPTIWFSTNQEKITEGVKNVTILLLETGSIDDNEKNKHRYLGSILMDDGHYILHAFEVTQ